MLWSHTLVLKIKCSFQFHRLVHGNDTYEPKLLSTLNTWGYIEFNIVCALSSLEEKFECTEFPWLSRYTYHFIGKYNCKGDYMVHRVYICSNLNSPFCVHQYDQIEGGNIDNNIMWRFPSFPLKK